MKFVKLSCRACGAPLEIAEDIDQFACSHCGSQWIVERQGGIVSLKAVEQSLRNIEVHTSSSASNTEILALEAQLRNIRKRIKDLIGEKKGLDTAILYSGDSWPNFGCFVGCCIPLILFLVSQILRLIFEGFIRVDFPEVSDDAIAGCVLFIWFLGAVLAYQYYFKDKIEDEKSREAVFEENRKARQMEIENELQQLRQRERELEEKIITQRS